MFLAQRPRDEALLAAPARVARRGFTLVELLVTIAVLSVLAGVMLVGFNGAVQSVKKTRTQALIRKIDALLMERWASYESRRVESYGAQSLFADSGRRDGLWRRYAIHSYQRLELPDRLSDIPDPGMGIDDARKALYVADLDTLPPLSLFYQRILAQTPNRTMEFESAECLFLVIRYGMVDADGGRKQFREDEIGDVDGDGLKEFVDAWGNPISFLRWAPGFSNDWPDVSECSDLMRLDADNPYSYSGGLTDWGDEHDEFALFPLIYSHGPDGKSGIWHGNMPRNARNPFWGLTSIEDILASGARGVLAGSPFAPDPAAGVSGQDHEDNLHNQMPDVR